MTRKRNSINLSDYGLGYGSQNDTGFEYSNDMWSGTGYITDTTASAPTRLKLKSLFGNKLSELNNISLRNIMKNGIGDPELLGWSPKNGITLSGGNLGNLYTGGKGLIDAFSYLDSANKMSKASQEGKDIKSEILASAASNPLASQYLTSDEIRTLNQIKRGSYSPEGTGVFDDPGAIGLGALKGGLTGLVAGGVPGAVLGAIGSGANAGIKSRRSAQENTNYKLESLLQSLNDASAQYKSMRRPNFTGLGIQSRFQDYYR